MCLRVRMDKVLPDSRSVTRTLWILFRITKERVSNKLASGERQTWFRRVF